MLDEDMSSDTFNVLNLGEPPLAWTATSSDARVTVNPGTGTGDTVVTVLSVDFTADYVAAITVANDDDPADTETVLVEVSRTTDGGPPGEGSSEGTSEGGGDDTGGCGASTLPTGRTPIGDFLIMIVVVAAMGRFGRGTVNGHQQRP